MDEKPITDTDNFPAGEKASARIVCDLTELAFADGKLQGYRTALMELALYSMLFLLVASLIRHD